VNRNTLERWLQRRREYRNASLTMKITVRRAFRAAERDRSERIQRIVQSLVSMAMAAQNSAQAMDRAARAFRLFHA
jgi:hypothetical protein